MKRRVQVFGAMACVVALGAAFVACGKDEPGTTETPAGLGEYRGLVATDTGLGVLAVTVRDASTTAKGLGTKGGVAVSGTFTFDDASIAVTGSGDGRTVTLSGGGYTISGTIADGALTVTVSRGASSWSATLFSGGSSIQLYCGRYDGPKSGPLGVAVVGARAAGAVVVAGKGATLVGTASGASFQLTGFPPSGKVDGAIAGATMSGTWTDGVGGSGTFDGTPDKCPRGTGGDAGADTGADTGSDTGATDTGSDTGATDTGSDTGSSDAGGACTGLALGGIEITETAFGGSDPTTYTGGTVVEGRYHLNARKYSPFESAPKGTTRITMRLVKKPGGSAQEFLYERIVSDGGTPYAETGTIKFGTPPFTGGSTGTNGYQKTVSCPSDSPSNSIMYSVVGSDLELKWFRGSSAPSEIYGGWEQFKYAGAP
jgi:hypothetical protein